MLPGAFCAFRGDAMLALFEDSIVQTNKEVENLIWIGEKVFLPKNLHEANLYITEDRIISTNVFFLRGKKYKLEYSPISLARADPVVSYAALLN